MMTMHCLIFTHQFIHQFSLHTITETNNFSLVEIFHNSVNDAIAELYSNTMKIKIKESLTLPEVLKD